MAQETLTLRTMNNGGIIEAVDAALAKIAENIADINTPPHQPRRRHKSGHLSGPTPTMAGPTVGIYTLAPA